MLELGNGAVLHETVVGQSETGNMRRIAVVAEPFHDGRAETSVADTVLDSDDAAEFPAYLVENLLVKGL